MVRTVIIAAESENAQELAEYTASLAARIIKEGLTAVEVREPKKVAEPKKATEPKITAKVAEKVKEAGKADTLDIEALKQVFNKECIGRAKKDPEFNADFKRVKNELGIKTNKDLAQRLECLPIILERLGIEYA